MNRAHRIALPLFIAIAAASVGACKGGEKPAAPATSAPEGKPGVTVTNARLVLPAVPGNPGAAYFAIDNQSKDVIGIATVAVQGAGKTELHTADMKVFDHATADPRTTLKFEPGQAHVMVFDVGANLKAGAETELTVTFTDGDKLSVPAKIEAMGAGAMAAMPVMGATSEAPKP
jgi:periplasmic copper chaperone A